LSVAGTVAFDLATADEFVVVTLDCNPPVNPDELGPVVSVSAPDLPEPAGTPDHKHAGFWRWSGRLDAGAHRIAIRNAVPGAIACNLSVDRPDLYPQACMANRIEYRSANTEHTHIPVGTTSPDWENPPVSGHHWGSWAAWNTVYPKPVQTGFAIHNMEHGGFVLSYNCASAADSAECRMRETELKQLMQGFGEPRVIVTPDPAQKAAFLIRTWRWLYQTDCLDPDSALEFMHEHFRHGREEEDASPPVAFDPTTTTVPCMDLMNSPHVNCIE
jgi:hypothetical protein